MPLKGHGHRSAAAAGMYAPPAVAAVTVDCQCSARIAATGSSLSIGGQLAGLARTALSDFNLPT
jgi:hypothetical protein